MAPDDARTTGVSTPKTRDLSHDEHRSIVSTIESLDVDDTIDVTADLLDEYLTATVTETDVLTTVEGDVHIVRLETDGDEIELSTNYRDIPEDAEDQELPYTDFAVRGIDEDDYSAFTSQGCPTDITVREDIGHDELAQRAFRDMDAIAVLAVRGRTCVTEGRSDEAAYMLGLIEDLATRWGPTPDSDIKDLDSAINYATAESKGDDE